MGVKDRQECHALIILLNNYYKPQILLQKGWKSSVFRIPLQAEKESNN